MIHGGIETKATSVELSLTVRGGRTVTRVYNDVVSIAIDKYSLISSMLRKLVVPDATPDDIKFYIDQVEHLLHRAHVELIPGNHAFQHKYNMWLLDGYVRMLLETTDMKLISQLLYIDSILYTIEEANSKEGHPVTLDFVVPPKLKVITISQVNPTSKIFVPTDDTLNAYLHSLNHNIDLMNTLIIANKSALNEIYVTICNVAARHLK